MGTWYYWRVIALGSQVTESGPVLPEAYRRFWKEPAERPTGAHPDAASAPPNAPAVSPAAELKALQGQWKVVRVEKGKDADRSWGRIVQGRPGSRGDADPARTDRFDFRSPEHGMLQIRSQLPEFVTSLRFRIDPGLSPKTIDLLLYGSNRVARDELVGFGIYEIEPDRLKICLTSSVPWLQERAQRPTSFAIEPNSANISFVFQRYTPPEDERAISGNWTIVTQTEDGKAELDATPASLQWRFVGDTVTTKDRGTVPFVLDVMTQPKQITLFRWQREDEKLTEQRSSGIYKLDGNRLTVAYRKDGPRPEKFESLPGSGVTLLELERAKPQPAAPAEASRDIEPKPLPALEPKPAPEVAVAVLDDCDPNFKEPGPHHDGIRLLAADGTELYVRQDLNNCETVGDNHGVVIDSKRQRVYFRELVAGRVTGIDFAGKTLFTSSYATDAIAVDPKTGNLWCLSGGGTIYGEKLYLLDNEGGLIRTYPIAGFDIAYDPHDDAFWIVGKGISKIDRNGKALFQGPEAKWVYAAVAPNPHDGSVWVVERVHPDVPDSANRLLLLDGKGGEVRRLELEGRGPFGVACDAETGTAWVVIYRKGILRVPVKGDPLPLLDFPAVSIAIGPSDGHVWIGTPNEVLRLDKEGKVLVRYALGGESGQSWLSAR